MKWEIRESKKVEIERNIDREWAAWYCNNK
jgi:hypothetical protein